MVIWFISVHIQPYVILSCFYNSYNICSNYYLVYLYLEYEKLLDSVFYLHLYVLAFILF